MTSLHELSIAQLLTGYRDRTLSPVEVTRAVLDHVALWEPHLNATYAWDPDGALAMAKDSETRWRTGEPLTVAGLTLDGVPTTIKENIATRGVAVPLGTAAMRLVPASNDAPPAARLREAGAVFLGKTTMPDFGMLSSGLSSFHGITRNPWHLDRNPGGSSAGAGAAAAAGYGPLHLGTDIGGSVRLPANWCGIFALKPSLGRVPIDPPYMGRVVGPMTRSVEDAARAMGILSQPDRRDHMNLPWQPIEWMQLERSLKGIRIGLLLEVGCGLPVNPEVRTAVEDAARAFAAAGAIVEPMQPWCNEALLHGTDNFWRARAWSDLKNLDADRRANVLPFIRSWAESGAALSGEDVFHAYTQTVNLRAATNFALQPYDYVLSPVSPVSSFAAELPCPTNELPTALDHIGFTAPYNMGEQPAASINCGYTGEGLPIGLQIAGHRFDDLGVLQMARAWEVMRPEQKAWPQVPIR